MQLSVGHRRVAVHGRRSAAAPRHRLVDALAAAAGLGLGVVVGLAVSSESSLSAPGGGLTFAGRLTGLVGAYAMLLTVLLAGRLGVLERAIGQDRLVAWHRRLAPWSLVLIGAHTVLTVLGYAQRAGTGPLHEFWSLVTTTRWMLAATVGLGLLTFVGVSSYRGARRRMSHETWWSVHLYTYLGLALAFTHQITSGAAFVAQPWARTFWIALWLGTAGVVLAYRVLLPVWRSVVHRVRVERVTEEAPGIVSLTLTGRSLHTLPLSGGQFLHWRFLRRGMWWQAHPYSVSALPAGGRLRITVKDLGDHSRALADLPVGTRVAFEGPYGAFTADRAAGRRVLAIAGGVGVTPIRTLLEELPPGSAPIVVLRATHVDDLVHDDEIEVLARRRGGFVHRLVGSRRDVHMSAATLLALAPDIAQRDVYLCGPDGLTEQAYRAAVRAGVPADRIHHETFSS
ncbi:MAG: putative ferric reductase [Solirubrobacterales bacterium]|nr:putative ferric reductase [Solirubrobacterales bacterium]